MANLVRSLSGHLLRGPSGNLRTCCCDNCHCSDGVPDTVTVTFAGVTMQTACLAAGGGANASGSAKVTSGILNGTYTLTKATPPVGSGFDCYWNLEIDTIEVVGYQPLDSTCSVPLCTINTINIGLGRVVTGWQLTVGSIGLDFFAGYCCDPTAISPYDGSSGLGIFSCLFRGEGDSSTCLTVLPGMSNDLVASSLGGYSPLLCGHTSQFNGGYGGTVTMSVP